MSKIEIITSRLILSPLKKKDISSEYISWLNNKELMKYSLHSLYTHDFNTCSKYLEDNKQNGNLFLGIFYKKLNKIHIGNIIVSLIKFNNSADISILIGNKDYHHKEIACEAWSGVMEYLFQTLKISKITAGTCVENKAMISLAKKVDMFEDGIKKKQYVINAVEHDVIYFGKMNAIIL